MYPNSKVVTSSACYLPEGTSEEKQWWDSFEDKYKEITNENGKKLFCVAFVHREKSLGNVMVVTGWSETFLKYVEIIKQLYEDGFNVYSYDHQCQGFSDRQLSEKQFTWVPSFDAYVKDFTLVVNNLILLQDKVGHLPLFVVAHSMGGLVVSIAMTRSVLRIKRCVLLAPMLR